MATKEEILDSIANMTVLELSELLKEFEDKFGVTAAAPAAVAAPAAAVSASSAPAAPAGRSLAYTGASVTLPALGGLAALVLGAALVIAGRRRRSLR